MPSVLSAAMFFPRGGSATVVRAHARRLGRHGWDARVVAGSLPGHGDAERFYTGVDLHPVPFAPHGDVPLHPSYEDRDEAGDGVFAALSDTETERHVAAWAQHLAAAGAADADVLHLHHLTPINEAAQRVAPDVPVVAHLHGTELLMLERIAEGAPATWAHADAWARRLRTWAHRARTVVLPSRLQLGRVERLLGIGPERCVVVPNGVDLRVFDRVEVDRAAHWRRHLADESRGWRPGGEEGSVAATPAEALDVARHPVVLYVGRFTAVKRLPILIEAWAAVQERLGDPASLVLVGGHPGEWEGEHPAELIERTGTTRVYLAGWHAQEALPAFLSASDLLVLPSVREQFGMVVAEAMACGIAPVAVDAYGPKDIVRDGETGWLVAPDDAGALAGAITAALADPAERTRRAAAARQEARSRFGWDAQAELLARVLDAAAPGREPARAAVSSV